MAILSFPGTVPGFEEEHDVPSARTRALRVYLGLPGRPWATRATLTYELQPKALNPLGRALLKQQARKEGRRVLFKPLARGYVAAWLTAPLCSRSSHPSVAGCSIMARDGSGMCGPCARALGLSNRSPEA